MCGTEGSHRFGYAGMAFGRVIERRRSIDSVHRGEVGFSLQECIRQLEFAVVRFGLDRRLTRVIVEVHVGAALDQHEPEPRMSVFSRDV